MHYNSKTTKPTNFYSCDNIWVQQNSFCDNTNGLRYTRIVIGNPISTQVLSAAGLFSPPHSGLPQNSWNSHSHPSWWDLNQRCYCNFHIPSCKLAIYSPPKSHKKKLFLSDPQKMFFEVCSLYRKCKLKKQKQKQKQKQKKKQEGLGMRGLSYRRIPQNVE